MIDNNIKIFENMDYNDIINHPHHVSTRHAQMSLLNRAAQFAPFSALAGYEDALRKTAEESEKRYNTK